MPPSRWRRWTTPALSKVARFWADYLVGQALVIAFRVVQLSNTTPILGISVKSAIPGIRGTAGQYGCMPLS